MVSTFKRAVAELSGKLKGTDPELGAVASQFEAHDPAPGYADGPFPRSYHEYPIVYPAARQKTEPLSPRIKALTEALWTGGQVDGAKPRSHVTIGARSLAPGGSATRMDEGYVKQVSLVQNGTTFADDWWKLKTIVRTDAVTMRGDARSPAVVIGREGGFSPPIERTDEHYMRTVVFKLFQSYMQRRYGQAISEQEFMSAIERKGSMRPDRSIAHVKTNPMSIAEKRLLVGYASFMALAHGEAHHLGRMVSDERLKGFISTSRSFFVASDFATASGARDAWVYITLVRGGWKVPPGNPNEQEIAQWGRIPAQDILGFRKIAGPFDGRRASYGVGPIYVRPKFRKTDPEAFRRIHAFMSDKLPDIEDEMMGPGPIG